MIKLLNQHLSDWRKKNTTLNQDKSSYIQTTVDFFKYTFSDVRFPHDPKVLHDCAALTKVSEVHSPSMVNLLMENARVQIWSHNYTVC